MKKQLGMIIFTSVMACASTSLAKFNLSMSLFTTDNSVKLACVINQDEVLIQNLLRPPAKFQPTVYSHSLTLAQAEALFEKYRLKSGIRSYQTLASMREIKNLEIRMGFPFVNQGAAPPSECNGSAPGCGGDFVGLSILSDLTSHEYHQILDFVFVNCELNEPELYLKLKQLMPSAE